MSSVVYTLGQNCNLADYAEADTDDNGPLNPNASYVIREFSEFRLRYAIMDASTNQVTPIYDVSHSSNLSYVAAGYFFDFSDNTKKVTVTGGSYGDFIRTGSGSDSLEGGKGVDALYGGKGNDTYIIRDNDYISEQYNDGIDTVKASISHTLTYNLEKLLLSGKAKIDGTGNELNNLVQGNTVDNTIDGKAGADILTGFGGSDTFAFSTKLASGTIDHITDFDPSNDMIGLDPAVFGALNDDGSGHFDPTEFKDITTNKSDATDHILYNVTKGALYYDADGYGGTAKAVVFALLDNKPALTAAEFLIA